MAMSTEQRVMLWHGPDEWIALGAPAAAAGEATLRVDRLALSVDLAAPARVVRLNVTGPPSSRAARWKVVAAVLGAQATANAKAGTGVSALRMSDGFWCSEHELLARAAVLTELRRLVHPRAGATRRSRAGGDPG